MLWFDYSWKAFIGAAIVIIIQLISQSKNYYVAGLVPLFPTFGMIAYYIVGTEHPTSDLKAAIVFGMFSILPYLIYLITLYFLVDIWQISLALLGATFWWIVAATTLIVFLPKS
jgi:uncharacterized membrane protein (GlpM family)